MSKIGKISISIPEKVKVVLAGNMINIEGPLGKKSVNIDLEMFNLDIKEGKKISIKPKKIDQNSKRLWGMNRSLINNAVIGSSKGYEKILELVGVGYRAALKGNKLNLQLGYSHDIDFDIPDDIKITVEKQTTLKISGSDKQQVGSVASKDRFRLSISRSSKNITAQIIDDSKNVTLLSASSIEKDIRSGSKVNKTELSKIVAEKLAKKAKEKKIIKVFFDRGVYKYHGRVKVFAETLRKNGMDF